MLNIGVLDPRFFLKKIAFAKGTIDCVDSVDRGGVPLKVLVTVKVIVAKFAKVPELRNFRLVLAITMQQPFSDRFNLFGTNFTFMIESG